MTMSEFMLWLECLTMEERFLFTGCCIAAFTLLFTLVAVWMDKKMGKDNK